MSQLRKEELHRIGDTEFYLQDNFSNLKEIGRGSYGVVVSALDSKKERHVAIKKISPMAKHTMDAKHVLREIRLMRHMGRHDNIISLEDLIIRENADELYIVMELLDSDLHRVLQSKQPLTESHFRTFMHQLFCGVKYLHDNRIIHRDLKPGNLLVTRDCKLRITDFGLARERPEGKGGNLDTDIDVPMTEHVVTRWYRPPELMLCPDGLYDYAVDMWSCGCIFGEMLGRRPLFPGKNFIHQLTLIFDIIGSPNPSEVAHIRNLQAIKFLESQRAKDKTPFQMIYPDASKGAIAMLECLLLFTPNERFNADEALKSPYLAAIKDTPSLIFPPVSEMFEFCFERTNLSKYQLKQMIINESRSLRNDKGKKNSHSHGAGDGNNKHLMQNEQKEKEKQGMSEAGLKERQVDAIVEDEKIKSKSQIMSEHRQKENYQNALSDAAGAEHQQYQQQQQQQQRISERDERDRLAKNFSSSISEVEDLRHHKNNKNNNNSNHNHNHKISSVNKQQLKSGNGDDDYVAVQDENRLNEMVDRFKAIKMNNTHENVRNICSRKERGVESRTAGIKRDSSVNMGLPDRDTTLTARRKQTIPVSPKFSRMNYQSKRSEDITTIGTTVRTDASSLQGLKVRSKPLTMRSHSAQKPRRPIQERLGNNNNNQMIVASKRNIKSAGTTRRPVFY